MIYVIEILLKDKELLEMVLNIYVLMIRIPNYVKNFKIKKKRILDKLELAKLDDYLWLEIVKS